MKHSAPRRPARRRVVVLATVGAALSLALGLVGSATATSSRTPISSPAEALAALDQAQQQLDAVRAYLKSLPTPGPTTPPVATTTPVPTTTLAPTTTPVPAAGDTAAARFNWGTPLPASDEFTGTSVDTSKWSLPGECWPANDTVKNGRCASHVTVANGMLTETITADGKTGWVASKLGQRFGRWEVRARVVPQPGTSGAQSHPVLITWPDNNAFPSGGEYDFFEVDSRDTRVTAFLHHPTQSGVVQDQFTSGTVDLTQFHNYGFEWAPSGLTGYIDGQVWFHDTDPKVQAPGPMHLTMQLDNFVGKSGLQPTRFDIDFARIYKAS
jgi:beta-glucanase (GH16 family)